MNIDKKDYRLLYALEKNARASLNHLAKEAKISSQLAAYKIKQLELKNIIQGYHAIIDTSALGYTTYRIYLRLQDCTTQQRETLITKISSLSDVTIIVSTNGRWDVGMAVMVKNIQQFHQFWQKLMFHRSKLQSWFVCIYSPIYHFTREYLNPDKQQLPKVRILGNKKEQDHDQLDLDILRKLAPNIRTSLSKIALTLNKPVQTIINRLKRLEKTGIIQGYRPILDWPKLGFEYFKVDLYLKEHTNLKKLENRIRQIPHIFQIDKTIGGSDIEIEIYAKSLNHLREILDELQKEFPQIMNYEYLTIEKTYKEEFMPS